MKKIIFQKFRKIAKSNKKFVLAIICILFVLFIIAYYLYCSSLVNAINFYFDYYNYSRDSLSKDTTKKYIDKFLILNKMSLNLPTLFLDNSTILIISELSDIYKVDVKLLRYLKNPTEFQQQKKCSILKNKYLTYYYNDNSYSKELLNCYNVLINNAPENPEYYVNRAEFQDDNAKKISDYEKSIEILDKELSTEHNEHFKCSESPELSCTDKKAKIKIDAYLGLFNVIKFSGNNDKALEIGEKVSDLMFFYPKYVDSYFFNELGDLYMKKGNKIAAYDNYLTALYNSPYSEGFYSDLIETIENNPDAVEYGIAQPPVFPEDFKGYYNGYLRKRAYIETARCLKEHSFIACNDAIKLNKQAETDFAFIAYKTLGDLNSNLKNYGAALINYEIALSKYSEATFYCRHYIPTEEERVELLNEKSPYNKHCISIDYGVQQKIRQPIKFAMDNVKS